MQVTRDDGNRKALYQKRRGQTFKSTGGSSSRLRRDWDIATVQIGVQVVVAQILSDNLLHALWTNVSYWIFSKVTSSMLSVHRLIYWGFVMPFLYVSPFFFLKFINLKFFKNFKKFFLQDLYRKFFQKFFRENIHLKINPDVPPKNLEILS